MRLTLILIVLESFFVFACVEKVGRFQSERVQSSLTISYSSVTGSFFLSKYLQVPGIGYPSSQLLLRNAEGNFSNRVFLVHFWASWCKPCAEEIPLLLEFIFLHPTLFDGFALISLDENIEDIFPILNSFSQLAKIFLFDNVFFLRDPSNFSKNLGVTKLPETHIVKNFLILNRIIGSQNWRDTKIVSFLSEFKSPPKN